MGPLIEQIDERTIQIRGVLAVGDTDNEAGIEDVRYDSDADTLTFIVSNHWAGTIGLGDALGIDGYEARITFESIPERLIATEIDWQGDEYTTIFEL
ncbi:hypothetical protein [Natronomonas sp.]|uniref:hypothetical protein n=1 Tax=Natronomonas sp. TaxID=2184060 RepID=UPI0039892998